MGKTAKNTFLTVIIVLFSLLFLAQSAIIMNLISSQKKVPVFMPLLVPGENYSSYDLEKMGGQTAKILQKAGRIGPTISLEDMVRGILLLEKKKESVLTQKQKNKILEILKSAYKEREELLSCQNEILSLQGEIPALGRKINDYLTPQQKNYINSNRDKISLKEFEESSWQELISALEKNIE